MPPSPTQEHQGPTQATAAFIKGKGKKYGVLSLRLPRRENYQTLKQEELFFPEGSLGRWKEPRKQVDNILYFSIT